MLSALTLSGEKRSNDSRGAGGVVILLQQPTLRKFSTLIFRANLKTLVSAVLDTGRTIARNLTVAKHVSLLKAFPGQGTPGTGIITT